MAELLPGLLLVIGLVCWVCRLLGPGLRAVDQSNALRRKFIEASEVFHASQDAWRRGDMAAHALLREKHARLCEQHRRMADAYEREFLSA